MSESKHTPGPLVAHKQPEGDIIDHAYSILTNGEECRCVALINLDVGTFADLRLWASAPDLLEALKWMVELCQHSNPGAFSNGVTDSTGSIDEGDVIASRIIGEARAAIAKATGGRDE